MTTKKNELLATAAALVVLAGLAGCITHTVHLRYPDGRVVECGGNYSGMSGPTAAAMMRGCINDHMTQGAMRID